MLPVWRKQLTRGLTVFVFHEITADPSAFHREHGTYTRPETFKRQLAWITSRFDVIEPRHLRRLGGSGGLPPSAALVTFDDAWAGTFRAGLPILREMNLSALWFLNMGTVGGDPDLAAVRAYERTCRDPIGLGARRSIDLAEGLRLLDRLRHRYIEDAAFWSYQGPTAEASDLEAAQAGGCAWFGSHLQHHWDIRSIRDTLLVDSLRENASKLSQYPNALPAFATPHGYAGEDGRDVVSVANREGVRVVFTGCGYQNANGYGGVIDRITLPAERSNRRGWWHATHLARAAGPRLARTAASKLPD